MDNNKSYFSKQIPFLREISDVLSNNVSFEENTNESKKESKRKEPCLEMRHKFLQCIDNENNEKDCSKYFEAFFDCYKLVLILPT